MKIALILDRFFPNKGGAESAVYQLAKYLLAQNHEVHVLTESYDDSLPASLHFHPLPVKWKIGWLRVLLFGKKVGKEVAQHDFDIVLGFNKTWLGLNCFQPHGGTTRASRVQNVKVYRFWGERCLKKIAQQFSLKQWVFGWIEKKQYANRDCTFFALSEMVKSHMQLYYQVPSEQIRVIYNGVHLDKFNPEKRGELRSWLERQYPELKGKVLFLFVAHNFKLKGLAPLIEAFGKAKIEKEKYQLLILGRGKEKKFRKLAKKYGVESNLFFLKADPEPEKYFAAADVFVHPTFYDPCSLVLLEAMAAGLPCLTSQFNGAGELLTHEESGLLVPDPWDIETLKLSLEKLMQQEIRDSLGKAARLVAEQYPWNRSFEEMLAVFEEVIVA